MSLDIIAADPLAGTRHGFFGRRGGVSDGLYQGLNCGFGSNDDAAAVTANRARVAGALDVPTTALSGVHQIHSADVVTLTQTTDARPKADAMVTTVPGIALSILTADCMPVLFADQTNGVIGAAHAGWKGALAGILENTIDAMCAIGAERAQIKAAIGPCISQRAYEVGPEFLDAFLLDDPEHARFFAGGDGDRVHFDLAGFGLHKLRAAGAGHVTWTGHCTYSDPARFFSYRRSTHEKQPDYGRLIGAIRL